MLILKKNVKWSPDGCRVEVVAAGSYQDGELPDRFLVIAEELGAIDTVEGGEKKPDADQQPEQPEQPEQPAPQKSKK
ncbi:hypothetical protein [Enterobacter sp. RHBSTW-00175]|uniref:hypothetical protein n=1 Tax=Enterobacter sp. RHBSTW-00175 TaxID=2742639 RepID=UPI0015EAC993|nr:hypothetical protein [Enterobacter sp. RHBSTW-00175]QMR77823.1 hypothetical protein HV107_20410 [Enterobacter sp. RHBSTW-00175]